MAADMREDSCYLCGHTRREHLDLEARAQLHHKFALEGEPLMDIPKKKSTEPKIISIGVPQTNETLLRLLAVLTRKGILTDAELVEVVSGNAQRADGDSSSGT